MKELRSSVILTALTLVSCCVAYPLALWAAGWAVFPEKAAGSLVADDAGRVVGSRLVAQPFTADEYFWPRPSAAGYNAAAAGGSNWGANNPKLRDRVAQQLGPMVRYKPGSPSAGTGTGPRTPQQDVAAWFAAKPDRLADWAAEYTTAATNYANTFPEADRPAFADFARRHPGKWPVVTEAKAAGGAVAKRVEPGEPDAAASANLFDMWLQDPANRAKAADLEPVPADMVTASGAGLDPHITVRNARSVYQLDRVAAKRGVAPDRVAGLVEELAFTPLVGLVGEPLVNVLELNRELDRRFPVPAVPAKTP